MGVPTKLVVIVGGGLSGLTAAVQLGRLGVSTLLFDGEMELGGRARTECRNGFHLNFGPHRLFEGGAGVTTLRRLNVPIDTAPRGPNGGLAVWRGRPYTLPVGYCSLLTTELLSAGAKRELAQLLTSLRTVDVAALHRVSIGQWLRTRESSADVLQLVLAMVRQTTYCNDPDRLSASAAIDQLRLSMSGVVYVHRGWASLVASLRDAAIASGGRIDRNRRAARIDAEDGRARSVTLADGARVAADAVIVATGPRAARQLFHRAADYPVSTTPVHVAALDVALRRLPRRKTVFAFGIDEPWCFSADSVVAHVAPGDGAVVHLAKFLRTGAEGTPLDERHLERVLDLLQPGWRDLVLLRRFVRTAPVAHAIVDAGAGGFPGRPSGRVPGLQNVFLAGDWVGPIGQLADASIASGAQAARSAAGIVVKEAADHGAD
jgi:phytoene dehydrogenase-like protein